MGGKEMALTGYTAGEMKRISEKEKLLIHKIIYAKRHTCTAEQVQSILMLEIETHLRNNPDLQFDKVGDVVKNADLSQSYPLHFKVKVADPAETK